MNLTFYKLLLHEKPTKPLLIPLYTYISVAGYRLTPQTHPARCAPKVHSCWPGLRTSRWKSKGIYVYVYNIYICKNTHVFAYKYIYCIYIYWYILYISIYQYINIHICAKMFIQKLRNWRYPERLEMWKHEASHWRSWFPLLRSLPGGRRTKT